MLNTYRVHCKVNGHSTASKVKKTHKQKTITSSKAISNGQSHINGDLNMFDTEGCSRIEDMEGLTVQREENHSISATRGESIIDLTTQKTMVMDYDLILQLFD